MNLDRALLLAMLAVFTGCIPVNVLLVCHIALAWIIRASLLKRPQRKTAGQAGMGHLYRLLVWLPLVINHMLFRHAYGVHMCEMTGVC
jgi:hypothetical protein